MELCSKNFTITVMAKKLQVVLNKDVNKLGKSVDVVEVDDTGQVSVLHPGQPASQ